MAPVSVTHKATAHREGDWWVIDVDGIGATQTKRLDQADGTARDLIASMLDVDPAGIQVDITPEVGPELDGLVLSARTAADAAKEAQAKAAETSRATADLLHEAGYSMRDIGVLIGVSYQRIHQLLEGKATRVRGKAPRVRVRGVKVGKTTTKGAMGGRRLAVNAAGGKKASSKSVQQAPVDA